MTYSFQIGQFWESFQAGQPNIDQTERFQIHESVGQTFDSRCPAIVQVQFRHLKKFEKLYKNFFRYDKKSQQIFEQIRHKPLTWQKTSSFCAKTRIK